VWQIFVSYSFVARTRSDEAHSRSRCRHGQAVGADDMDIVLAWTKKALVATEKALNGIGLVSRLPVTADDVFRFRDEYIHNRNLIGWDFYSPDDPAEQVDIVITYDLKGRRLARISTQAGPVQILWLRDLIKMKQASERPSDIEDVKALEKPK
jgi:hypothetical protein